MNFMQATEMLELLRSIDNRLVRIALNLEHPPVIVPLSPVTAPPPPQYGRSTAAPPEAQINAEIAAGQHEKQRLYGVRPAFRMKPDAAGRMVPDQTQASPDFLPGEDVG